MFPLQMRKPWRRFQALCRCEGIIPALESSHAVAEAIKRAPQMSRDEVLLVKSVRPG